MNPKRLFLLFLLVPIVELYFLVTVGSIIGAWLTVSLVILTAIIGVFLVRLQGILTLFRLQEEIQRGGGSVALLEGVVILIGGVLLLTPGFLTDAMGFICLVPSWRRRLIVLFVPDGNREPPMGTGPHGDFRGQGRDQGRDQARNQDRSVIEGNFRREDE